MNLNKFALLAICTTLLLAPAAQGKLVVRPLGENGGANSNPHNLSSISLNAIKPDASSTDPLDLVNESQICVFCHVPHGATYESTLWNRYEPNNMGSFSFCGDGYGNPDAVAIDDPDIVGTTKYSYDDPLYPYPNGASKLCLSCHDGITALGIMVNGDLIQIQGDSSKTLSTLTTPSTLHFGPGGALDLAVSHPISFYYNTAVVNYLNNAAPYDYGPDRKSSTYTMPSTSGLLDSADPLKARVQCTTCHDPHYDTRNGSYNLPFWRNYTGDTNETADYDGTCSECHSAWGAQVHE